MLSKDGYYLYSVVMIVVAILLAIVTVAIGLCLQKRCLAFCSDFAAIAAVEWSVLQLSF